MLPHWFSSAAFLSALAGPVSHSAVWIHGEWDSRFHKLVPSLCLFQALPLFLIYWSGQSLFQSFYILSLLVVSYVASLFISVTIYRLFLHPTRIYRGPFWARLSSWWRVNAFISHNEQAYAVTDELHQKYGDIVRVGTVSSMAWTVFPFINIVRRTSFSLYQPCGCSCINLWFQFPVYEISQLYVDDE